MNTNPHAITVLCYGDSNTRGSRPDNDGRFVTNERWTGLLQTKLGDDYYVIEEGLGGRTTDLEHFGAPGRNGRQYLQPCLESHNPLDVIVLMLGTNDLKLQFDRSTADIARAIEGLLKDIQKHGTTKNTAMPQVLLVSPIEIDGQAPKFQANYTDFYDQIAVKKSQELRDQLRQLATRWSIHFTDAASVARAGEDGIHIDATGHQALADLLFEKLREITRS